MQSSFFDLYLHNDDCDEEPGQDEENAGMVQVRHCLIETANSKTGNESCDDIGHKYVPWLYDQIRVLESVHLHNSVGLYTH